MKKRSIILFPKFENQNVINEIRKNYDNLYNKIDPHITIVFPFTSNLSTFELRQHIKNSISHISNFKISFKSFSGSASDGYIFLDRIVGNDIIISLHDSLYTGVLKNEIYNETPYFPHITVGKIEEYEKFSKILSELNNQYYNEKFSCLIKNISVEIIDNDDSSILEMEIPLN